MQPQSMPPHPMQPQQYVQNDGTTWTVPQQPSQHMQPVHPQPYVQPIPPPMQSNQVQHYVPPAPTGSAWGPWRRGSLQYTQVVPLGTYCTQAETGTFVVIPDRGGTYYWAPDHTAERHEVPMLPKFTKVRGKMVTITQVHQGETVENVWLYTHVGYLPTVLRDGSVEAAANRFFDGALLAPPASASAAPPHGEGAEPPMKKAKAE